MNNSEIKIKELLKKAGNCPLTPGVYIMKNRQGKIIYVGKSKKLKNRLSHYFQNSSKSIKTERMVSNVDDFEYILCDSETEALALENLLIKQHKPKYNIKLKDAKSYPYIKIDAGEYPKIKFTRTRSSDKAKYFGPYSSTSTVYATLKLLHQTLGIPSCNHNFPKDIGRVRPCIYHQMRRCIAPCTGNVSPEEYNSLIKSAIDILRGHTSKAKRELEEKMIAYAELEQYESAAVCRDTIKALDLLKEKQHVVAAPGTDWDVFGLCRDAICSCISVIHVRDGSVTGKNDYPIGTEQIDDSEGLTSFLYEYYSSADYIPEKIYLSFELEEEDNELICKFISDKALEISTSASEDCYKKITIKTPDRGDAKRLCDTADANAAEKSKACKAEYQKDDSTLVRLAELLGLEVVPQRIEAYDISNVGREHKFAGMVTFIDGVPARSQYRSFKIKSVEGIDDYTCMHEALTRRLAHLSDTEGSFSERPDLILVDGGAGHLSVARSALDSACVNIPVYGMVKDDFHKTRALCTRSDNGDINEINIYKDKQIYMLIYRIQEEVHRYTVSKMTASKRKTLKISSLEKIEGIGPTKAKALLATFGSLSALKNADILQIKNVKGISPKNARDIVEYFSKGRENQ